MIHNDKIPLSPYVYSQQAQRCVADDCFDREALTRFHSRSAPGISVLDYLRRIVKFTKVEVWRRRFSEHVPYSDPGVLSASVF